MNDETDLPAGWKHRRVGDIVSLVNGFAFKASQWKKSGLPIIRIQNLNNPNAAFNYCDDDLAEKYLVHEDDLLFAWSGTPGTSFGAHIWRGPKALLNQHIFRVIFDREQIDLRYMRMAINRNLDDYIRAAHGRAGLAHITKGKFEDAQLRLAPLAEQRQIVAKIEELFSDLDAGVAALERVRLKLKRYRASVLNAAVTGKLTEEWREQNPPTEPADKLLARILDERRKKWEAEQLRKFTKVGKTPPKGWRDKYESPSARDDSGQPELPQGWAWTTVSHLISYLRNGWSLKPSPQPPGHRLLRINAVRPMSVDLDEVRFVDRPQAEVDGFFVEEGDLLFTRYNGSVELLGVCGRVRVIDQPTLHPDKLIRVRTVIDDPLNKYIELAAHTGISRKHMAGRARTTAGQTGISGTDIREMPIPLPPLAEQAEIVEEVERRLSVLVAVEAEIEHSLIRAARLRQAILKRAFEGKLVPQISGEQAIPVTAQQSERDSPGRVRGRAKRSAKLPREQRKHRKGIVFDRGAVMARVVHRLGSSPYFGRTEAMKTLYVSEAWLGIDLELEPVREKRGPLDKAIYKIESLAQKQRWFTTKKVGPMFRYYEGPNIENRLKAAERLIGDKLSEFDRLLDEMEKLDTDRAELFATTFAVWNDLLLDQRETDEASIVSGVHEWHPSKIEKFPADRIAKCIKWMNEKRFIPTGRGPRSELLLANEGGDDEEG